MVAETEEPWKISWRKVRFKMENDLKLGKIEEILSKWSNDDELCEKLKEIKVILVNRIKGVNDD